MALSETVQGAQNAAESNLDVSKFGLWSQADVYKLTDERASNGLGWLVIALGLGELAMTRTIARLSGIDQKYATVLRVYGAREIASGVGLLTAENKKPWFRFRVFGDLMDGAFLGWAFFKEKDRESRKRIAISAAVIAPVVAMDIYYAMKD